MALARLCMRNPLRSPKPLAALLNTPPSLSYSSATADSDTQGVDNNDIAVSQGSSANSPGRRRGRRDRGILPWRNPFDHIGGGLGHALMGVSQNLNQMLENLRLNRWLGQSRQDDKCYKLRYEVPGLSKEDLKITVEGRYLLISGEHKEEGDEDDEGWYSSRSFCNASVLLPEDAEVDGIKAEVKDGMLNVVIPRSEEKKNDVKEVQIQ